MTKYYHHLLDRLFGFSRSVSVVSPVSASSAIPRPSASANPNPNYSPFRCPPHHYLPHSWPLDRCDSSGLVFWHLRCEKHHHKALPAVGGLQSTPRLPLVLLYSSRAKRGPLNLVQLSRRSIVIATDIYYHVYQFPPETGSIYLTMLCGRVLLLRRSLISVLCTVHRQNVFFRARSSVLLTRQGRAATSSRGCQYALCFVRSGSCNAHRGTTDEKATIRTATRREILIDWWESSMHNCTTAHCRRLSQPSCMRVLTHFSSSSSSCTSTPNSFRMLSITLASSSSAR